MIALPFCGTWPELILLTTEEAVSKPFVPNPGTTWHVIATSY